MRGVRRSGHENLSDPSDPSAVPTILRPAHPVRGGADQHEGAEEGAAEKERVEGSGERLAARPQELGQASDDIQHPGDAAGAVEGDSKVSEAVQERLSEPPKVAKVTPPWPTVEGYKSRHQMPVDRRLWPKQVLPDRKCDCAVFKSGEGEALRSHADESGQGTAFYFDRGDGIFGHVPTAGSDSCSYAVEIGGFRFRSSDVARKLNK